MKTLHIDCMCYHNMHTLRLTSFEGEPIIYIDIHLVRPRFWKRIWYSLKYIFRNSDLGYEETVLDKDKAMLIKNFIDETFN